MQTASRGFTINYSVSGDGPPLLLVPGTLCAARQWADFGYAATLERHWRVIAVDPLGHGDSDTPHDADSYEAAGVTADLVAVFDAAGIEQATVWGYSRGGWLACNLASRCPDRVERLVVAAYAINAHEEEVDRILVPLIGHLREGNWSALWQAFGITDRPFQQMMQDGNDALAVAAAIDGSLRPTRYSIRSRSIALQTITSVQKTGSFRMYVPTSRRSAPPSTSSTAKAISGRSLLRLSRCWRR